MCGGPAVLKTRTAAYGLMWAAFVHCRRCGTRTRPTLYGSTGRFGQARSEEGRSQAEALSIARWQRRDGGRRRGCNTRGRRKTALRSYEDRRAADREDTWKVTLSQDELFEMRSAALDRGMYLNDYLRMLHKQELQRKKQEQEQN